MAHGVCWSRASVRLFVCLSLAAFPHYCTDSDVTLENGRECSMHYWSDLQSVHGFRCYVNITRTRNVSKCLYSLCAWLWSPYVIGQTIIFSSCSFFLLFFLA